MAFQKHPGLGFYGDERHGSSRRSTALLLKVVYVPKLTKSAQPFCEREREMRIRAEERDYGNADFSTRVRGSANIQRVEEGTPAPV